jgi:ubiquinol-cytochrome c reductase iron-sulfur subunit
LANADDDKGHVADEDRRDILFLATGATAAVGVASAVWPLIDQMNPSASVLALSTMEVDIGALEPGQEMAVSFLKAPVFIRRMTEEDMAEVEAESISVLPDPDPRNPNASGAVADLKDRLVDPERDIIVLSGVCTHLGCVPLGDGSGDFGGWFCPCHGSHYDKAGRIRRGPAPENLPVPVASLDGDTLKLG